MTSYNERLKWVFYKLRIEIRPLVDQNGRKWADEQYIAGIDEAKQALTSLTKELVAEAKPEVRVFDDGINDATYFQQKIVDQFEQNLLKTLEENSEA